MFRLFWNMWTCSLDFRYCLLFSPEELTVTGCSCMLLYPGHVTRWDFCGKVHKQLKFRPENMLIAQPEGHHDPIHQVVKLLIVDKQLKKKTVFKKVFYSNTILSNLAISADPIFRLLMEDWVSLQLLGSVFVVFCDFQHSFGLLIIVTYVCSSDFR